MRMKDIIRDCISNNKSLSKKVRDYLKENRKLRMMKNFQDF
jgi:hypothetical protein